MRWLHTPPVKVEGAYIRAMLQRGIYIESGCRKQVHLWSRRRRQRRRKSWGSGGTGSARIWVSGADNLPREIEWSIPITVGGGGAAATRTDLPLASLPETESLGLWDKKKKEESSYLVFSLSVSLGSGHDDEVIMRQVYARLSEFVFFYYFFFYIRDRISYILYIVSFFQ